MKLLFIIILFSFNMYGSDDEFNNDDLVDEYSSDGFSSINMSNNKNIFFQSQNNISVDDVDFIQNEVVKKISINLSTQNQNWQKKIKSTLEDYLINNKKTLNDINFEFEHYNNTDLSKIRLYFKDPLKKQENSTLAIETVLNNILNEKDTEKKNEKSINEISCFFYEKMYESYKEKETIINEKLNNQIKNINDDSNKKGNSINETNSNKSHSSENDDELKVNKKVEENKDNKVDEKETDKSGEEISDDRKESSKGKFFLIPFTIMAITYLLYKFPHKKVNFFNLFFQNSIIQEIASEFGNLIKLPSDQMKNDTHIEVEDSILIKQDNVNEEEKIEQLKIDPREEDQNEVMYDPITIENIKNIQNIITDVFPQDIKIQIPQVPIKNMQTLHIIHPPIIPLVLLILSSLYLAKDVYDMQTSSKIKEESWQKTIFRYGVIGVSVLCAGVLLIHHMNN